MQMLARVHMLTCAHALPPTLVLLQLKLKSLSEIEGFSGYEQWEEQLERFYVEEMLSAASSIGDVGGGRDGCSGWHHRWRQRMIGVPDTKSAQRFPFVRVCAVCSCVRLSVSVSLSLSLSVCLSVSLSLTHFVGSSSRR